MDALTEKLGIKLQEWKPEISDSTKRTLRERVRQYISEIIDLADRDVLNSLPSRTVEQDVLDLIDRLPFNLLLLLQFVLMMPS